MININVKKLAIYYGYPSGLNYDVNSWNLDKVADDFAQYDMVVLGSGLESSSHQDHNNTKSILGKTAVQNVEFAGYIDTIDGQTANETKIDNWTNMGSNVTIIFCDKFGYDFSVTRQQQNSLVDYIHNKGLKAFVNAWDVNDVFDGTPAHKLDSNDWYLAESYQITNGSYQTETQWRDKSNDMISYRSSEGVNMACVTTYDSSSSFSQDKFNYAYMSCVLDNFQAFGFGEYNFSSSSALMPYRTRPSFYGNKFTGNITNSNSVYERETNIGIHVNASNHRVSTSLD